MNARISRHHVVIRRAHIRAAGGVVHRILYDNLRAVVLAHVGADVRLNSRFLDFSAHYGFRPVACTPSPPTPLLTDIPL